MAASGLVPLQDRPVARPAPVHQPGHQAAGPPPTVEAAARDEAAGIGMPAYLQALQRSCTSCGGPADERAQPAPQPQPLQADADAAPKQATGAPSPLATAARGVVGAAAPLPGTARIQALFGRHDISGVRARVGGAAEQSARTLGARAYTLGQRVGFRSAPDLRLAAHEAAHTVQQRRGVQLHGGIGRPDDPYERQADAVAERVVAGASAEPLLDAAVPADDGPSPQPRLQAKCACGGTCAKCAGAEADIERVEDEQEAPGTLQLALEANATRLVEPALETGDDGAPADAGAAAGGGSPAAGGGETGADGADRADGAAAEPADAGAAPDAAADGSDGTGASAGAGTGTGTGTGTSAAGGTDTGMGAAAAPAAPAACAGDVTPRCYDGPREEPVDTPAEAPPNPPPAQVQEQTSDAGEEAAPEPDNCPPAEPGAAPDAAAAAAVEAGPAAASGAGDAAAPAGPAADAGAASAGASGTAAPPSAAGAADGAAAAEAPGAGLAAQRAAAVAGFQQSGAALAALDAGLAGLQGGVGLRPVDGEDAAAAAVREHAQGRIAGFFGDVAGRVQGVLALATGSLSDQLGAAAEAGKAAIAASIEAQKQAISARIAQARGQAHAQAALARSAVLGQAAAFEAEAQGRAAAAVTAVGAAHADAMARVDALETAQLDSVDAQQQAGRTQLEALGDNVASASTAIGNTYAGVYRGFRQCTEDGFWDGNLAERRAIAQEEAAHSVARGYHERITESSRRRAREITGTARRTGRCAVLAAAATTRDTLDNQHAQLLLALEASRAAATAQAGTARDGLLAGVDAALHATLAQLAAQEHEQRQAANDAGHAQQVLQEVLAHSAAAALQQAVGGAVGSVLSSLAALQATLAGSQTPDPVALDDALAQVAQRIGAALDALQSSLQAGSADIVGQLSAALGQGLAALDAVAAGSAAQAAALSAGHGAAMAAIAGSDNFAEQRAGFNQGMADSSSAGASALLQAVDGLRQGGEATLAAGERTLADAAVELEANLRQSQQGIECEIVRQADAAAAQEAPAWKRVLAVVLVIIVVVIVIAVIVASGGTAMAALVAAAGPIGAGILVGAAVGAVTSGLLAVAGNLWSNRDWTEGVGEAMLVGAITGAVGGGVGAGVGVALKGASTAVQIGADLLSNVALDLGTQFVTGGFSLDNFAWSNLGMTLVTTVLTLGLGHAVAARSGARPHAGADASPPTRAGGPEPVPTAEAPSARPAETGPDGAALAPEGRASPPPEAVPTAPEPARPATPEEAATLETTAGKNAEDLTPGEVRAERDVAARSEPEVINEPPFTTRRELPNGHEIKETPDGNLIERCSPNCALFDSRGNPVMRGGASAGPEGVVAHEAGAAPEVVEGRLSGRPEGSGTPETARPTEPGREGLTLDDPADLPDQPLSPMDRFELAAGGGHRHARLSESTTGPQRARAAEMEAGAARPDDMRSGEPDIGDTVPHDRPSDMFDDPEAPAPRAGEALARPGLNDNMMANIEANAPKNAQGQFLDANGQVIQHPTYGHRHSYENRRIIAAGEELGLTQAQLTQYVNSRPEFFQVEEFEVNLSHRDEMPGTEPFDHIVDDMIGFFNL